MRGEAWLGYRDFPIGCADVKEDSVRVNADYAVTDAGKMRRLAMTAWKL